MALAATLVLLATGLFMVTTERSELDDPVAAHVLSDVPPRGLEGAEGRPTRGGTDATRDELPVTAAERPPAPADAPPLEEFGPVVTQQPAVRVDGVTSDDPLPAVLGHDGVRFATVVRIATMAITGPDGQPHEVRIAAVDPRGFRVLTPQPTADALDLWQHLTNGAAVVEFGAAERVGLNLGSQVGLPERRPLPIGAIASLGDGAVADIVVSTESAKELGIEAPTSLLVSIAGHARASLVAQDVGALLAAEATPLVEDPPKELRTTTVPPGQWDDVWDRLAMCESGGRWHLDSGNGYFGGLQFLPSSWWGVGGQGMPHEASREEQIARAKILLAYQGWEAWPACSRSLGYR